jgi:hypothetical protein
MRVIVCGARHWYPWKIIELRLSKLPRTTTIVHGGCPGVDVVAGTVAKGLRMQVEEFPAKWKELGPKAGPVRNREMLKSGVNLVIAVHWDPTFGRGTRDMIRVATRAKVPVETIILDYELK